jgi:dTDP-4-amino-4,6-dideoxygalactose transaminase
MTILGKIPFNKPFIVGKEFEYIAMAINENGHLSGNGPFTKKCHAWLETRFSSQRALMTHSCTSALEMAALLCDIQPGDEVILPSFTFVSTANAFVLRGATPVFIDIRKDTLNMDETKIEAAITKKTRAIIPVHYAGVACEMDAILDIATRHNLWVIEDAAQSFNSTYKNRYLGTIGHLGCLSFHETKNIISGEGGALLVNDESFTRRAEIIWEKGTNRTAFQKGEVDKYTWVDIGSSYLPGELTTAFLYAQFEQSEKIITKRCRLFDLYKECLRSLEKKGDVQLPFQPDSCRINGHIFYILLSKESHQSRLIQYLKNSNISGVFHYIPLHSSPAGIKYGRTHGDLIVTNDIYKKIIRLPLYYEMEETDVFRVTDLIITFFNSL